MDEKLIIGRYENRENTQRLRMVGPISMDVLKNVFFHRKPNTWGAEEDGLGYGEASLLVESEEECSGLVNKLNNELKENGYKNYNIEYRGVIAVPPKELSSLKKPQDLYDLVRETLIKESNGEIKPKELVILDYQKALKRLEK
ncbi:MAG: hypothetical protein KJ968_00700 [Nanoarchaeota archaeon]|nr:hypothetical protein [Nanoarchaeota archaeon]MBU4283603.1 hypothetical protein [Nanoarchaeota archaeon]